MAVSGCGIVTGELKPGVLIDDKNIAAKLHISRTPVREALKRLSDERLVDIVAQSGTRVSLIHPEEVRQAYLIRRALEMEGAGQAASRMSTAHAQNLQEILSAHRQALTARHFAEAISIDDRFHRYIAEISNLMRLWQTIEISKAQLDRCRHKMVPRTGEAQATLRQHREIIAALQSGNPEASRQAMAAHLDSAMTNTMKVLAAETADAPRARRGPPAKSRWPRHPGH